MVKKMRLGLFLLLLIFSGAYSSLNIKLLDSRKVLNNQLFQDVLDPVLCEEQLDYLAKNNTFLLLQFLDAGIRVPRGLLQGNFFDFGNYHHCLGINEELPEWTIQGKHCAVSLPFSQNISLPALPSWPELPNNITWPDLPWPDLPWPELNPETLRIPKETLEFVSRQTKRAGLDSPITGFGLQLAVCIPQTCTSKQFLNLLFFNNSSLIEIRLNELYCRLPNDKQWVVGEFVAFAIFSFLGLSVFLSTCYDIHQIIILRNDPKSLNMVYQSFSVYTNTRRLVTYTPVPGAIECLDGIRTFAMMWVIVGHILYNQLRMPMANPMDLFDWVITWKAIWITLAPITVDTFFMIGGLLLVYTTAGKFPRWKLLKTLHLFYLHRLLRMFPILATFVLIQASFLSRMADGPHWSNVITETENCRNYWWSTLLYIQNWVNPFNTCLPQTWYLAIDVQLYILSPLVLIWVLGCKKTSAWTALIGSFLLVLAGSTVYCFIQNFPPGPTMLTRPLQDMNRYHLYYYINTLTRALPFFVGMIYGYLMHSYRGKEVNLSKIISTILWGCAVLVCAGITYIFYLIMQPDWDNQIADNFINSFIRPAWAIAIGWMVFACHHGYGGPINWVLSLRAWKVLSRLSYAMYISHYTLINLVDSTSLTPLYISPSKLPFKFISDFGLTAVVSFIITLLVDSPFSTLIKLVMGGGQRRRPPQIIYDDNQNSPKGIENAAFEVKPQNSTRKF